MLPDGTDPDREEPLPPAPASPTRRRLRRATMITLFGFIGGLGTGVGGWTAEVAGGWLRHLL